MASIVEGVKNTIAENFGGKSHDIVPDGQNFSIEAVPDQSGKVAVVTGGSEGIGYGVTHTLLARNISKVFVLSPSKEVVDGASEAVTKELGAETAKKLVWLQCDMSDWKRVVEVASEISSSTDRLDILVNNAARGIMTAQLDSHGVDRHMSVNHFGHVALTSHLLPLLKKTASQGNTVRIVNLGSNAHQSSPSDTSFATLDEINKDYGPQAQYGRSKLAAILYARYLARHLTAENPNILANSTHPGFVATKMSEQDIHEPYPLGGYAMSVGLQPFKKDQWQGAVSTLFAATATTKSGEYICPPAVPEAGNELANNEALGEQLMKITNELVKEKTYNDSAAKGCPFKNY